MTSVWAVWVSRDYEGNDLESLWDTEELAKARFEELKTDLRAYGYWDDVFYAGYTLNATSLTKLPDPIPPTPQISYKEWEKQK